MIDWIPVPYPIWRSARRLRLNFSLESWAAALHPLWMLRLPHAARTSLARWRPLAGEMPARIGVAQL